jgi:hypothetical protein
LGVASRVGNADTVAGRRPVQWNEVFDHFGTALPKEAIVHAWNDGTVVAKATSQGYDVLNSRGWYLDHLTTGWQAMCVPAHQDCGRYSLVFPLPFSSALLTFFLFPFSFSCPLLMSLFFCLFFFLARCCFAASLLEHLCM